MFDIKYFGNSVRILWHTTSWLQKGVIGLHVVFLILLLFGPIGFHPKSSHKPLFVKTVSTQPMQVGRVAPSTKGRLKSGSTTPAKPSPKVKQQEKSKATSSSPSNGAAKNKISGAKPSNHEAKRSAAGSQNKVEKKSSPALASEPVASIPQNLLAELERSLSQVEKHAKSLEQGPKTLSGLPEPAALQIDAESLSIEDGSFDDVSELIDYLYNTLELPERGAVKIELTLRQDGSVAKLIVLQAQSKRNKAYLEEKLIHLHFPSVKKEGQTLTLNFCNA